MVEELAQTPDVSAVLGWLLRAAAKRGSSLPAEDVAECRRVAEALVWIERRGRAFDEAHRARSARLNAIGRSPRARETGSADDKQGPSGDTVRFAIHQQRHRRLTALFPDHGLGDGGAPDGVTELLRVLYIPRFNDESERLGLAWRACADCGREVLYPAGYCKGHAARKRNRGREKNGNGKSPQQNAIARAKNRLKAHYGRCPICPRGEFCPTAEAMHHEADALSRLSPAGNSTQEWLIARHSDPSTLEREDGLIEEYDNRHSRRS